MLDEKNSTVNSEPINAELERDLKEVKLFLEKMLEQL
jgi:hypothetical protein